jgi:hypothetical protein
MMTNSDILMHESLGLEITLNHQCKTENGIENDEKYIIKEIIGNFEQLIIINQYKREVIINPNQLV